MKLATAASARNIDTVAEAAWGFNAFALVEAAGRACATRLLKIRPDLFKKSPELRIAALIGSGNNGADALVMIRSLVLANRVKPSRVCVLLTKAAETDVNSSANSRKDPRSEALRSSAALGIDIVPWDGRHASAESYLSGADLIVDGIAGTGISGALRGAALEMAQAIQDIVEAKEEHSTIVSIDVPSGTFDAWQPNMTVVPADITLAIEPVKSSMYMPALRPFAGRIVCVRGIFPKELLEGAESAELFSFQSAACLIPRISKTSYKHTRGVVEIHAGALGSSGAAALAAQGAQSAGAGLIRLIVDPEIRDIVATSAWGVMVATSEEASMTPDRFHPDSILIGPGWGRSNRRAELFASLIEKEKSGTAIVLDADAISLARGHRFSNSAILTPHPGEFAAFVDKPKEKVLASPIDLLKAAASEANAVVILKGHVVWIAASDGRLAVVDGMEPVLAAGGSGDILAGFMAALAGREARAARDNNRSLDLFPAAIAGVALLMEAGRTAARSAGFCDPHFIAHVAAKIAAKAWLPGGSGE